MTPFDPLWAKAISGIESSGRYNLVGPDNGKGNKPYGKYQVMDFNVGPWTKEAIGREMSPQDFLNDPATQDLVFRQQFGKNVDKYGSPQEAASVWFSGRPMAKAGNARDVLGTTVPAYVDKFNRAIGNPGVNAIEASMGNKQPSEGASPAMAFDTTPPPDDGFLGQLARFGSNASNGNYTLADAMGNAGVAMMSLDNAKGAGALATNLALTKKQQAKGPAEFQYDPKSGTFFRTRSDGTLETTKNPNVSDEPVKKQASESSLKNVAKTVDDYDYIHQTAGSAGEILDDIKSGRLNLGLIDNATNAIKNGMSMSDEQSQAYSRWQRFKMDLVNNNLRLNNGVQTEGDAYRELKAIANGTSYDNKTLKDALERVLDKSNAALSRGAAHLETRKVTYGPDQFEAYDPMVAGWKARQGEISARLKAAKDEQAQPKSAPAPSGKFEVMGVRRPN